MWWENLGTWRYLYEFLFQRSAIVTTSVAVSVPWPHAGRLGMMTYNACLEQQCFTCRNLTGVDP